MPCTMKNYAKMMLNGGLLIASSYVSHLLYDCYLYLIFVHSVVLNLKDQIVVVDPSHKIRTNSRM